MKKIAIGLVILVTIVLSYFIFFKKDEVKNGVIDEINGYSLESNKGDYYNSLFGELKELYKSEAKEEDEATLVAKLFLTDHLSLATARSKNDVGGIQFVYEPFRNDFDLIAKNTIYKFVENNVYGNRKQELPLVKSVIIDSIDESEFKIGKENVDVFKIKASIKYEKDLGYQKEVELLLYKKNDKFEVIKMD